MAETILDSGERRNAGTGSVRDVAKGKGRFDLTPLDISAKLIGSEELMLIHLYQCDGDAEHLYEAIRIFAKSEGKDLYTLLIELSQHYEAGCDKYGPNNWRLGQPLSWYLSSGVRHYNKHKRGDKDEPHDRAFVWNMFGIIWTHENLPEMIDLPFKGIVLPPPIKKTAGADVQRCGNCGRGVKTYGDNRYHCSYMATDISETVDVCPRWEPRS